MFPLYFSPYFFPLIFFTWSPPSLPCSPPPCSPDTSSCCIRTWKICSCYIFFSIDNSLFHQSYPDPPRLPSLLMLEKGSDLRRKSRRPDVNLVSKNGRKVCCCPITNDVRDEVFRGLLNKSLAALLGFTMHVLLFK